MLVSSAVTIFNVLQDKYGSPNVVTSEIIAHFNMAIAEYLNRLFPDSQGTLANFELDANVTANIQPLIFSLSPINMNGSGIVTSTVINTALATAASDVNATYFRIIAIGVDDGTNKYPVRYTKHNNTWAYQKNSFKAPSVTNPYFSLIASGLQLYPTDTTLDLTIEVLKNPKVLTTGDLASSFEFSDYVVYNIISIALKLAGISTRDEELLQDARLAGLQINQ